MEASRNYVNSQRFYYLYIYIVMYVYYTNRIYTNTNIQGCRAYHLMEASRAYVDSQRKKVQKQ